MIWGQNININTKRIHKIINSHDLNIFFVFVNRDRIVLIRSIIFVDESESDVTCGQVW